MGVSIESKGFRVLASFALGAVFGAATLAHFTNTTEKVEPITKEKSLIKDFDADLEIVANRNLSQAEAKCPSTIELVIGGKEFHWRFAGETMFDSVAWSDDPTLGLGSERSGIGYSGNQIWIETEQGEFSQGWYSCSLSLESGEVFLVNVNGKVLEL